jgi:hypothetical protein
MQFDLLKRREVITLLGWAAWPFAARAQQKPHTIGFLGPASAMTSLA